MKENGKYIVDIDISVEQWKGMLNNPDVFYPEAKEMILQWYFHEGHQATSKTIMNLYHPDKKGTIYNGIVIGLSKKILAYLKYSFWVESNDGKSESFWCIPFEGWHKDYDESKSFVWKLRDELIQAINENIEFKKGFVSKEIDNCESFSEISTKEGKKRLIYTTKYERKSQNRDAAIRLSKMMHRGRLICETCGFDFEKTYGEIGKNFIEVHHIKPLHSLEDEIDINPERDLICICSNCHRMIHRNKSETLSIEQLRKTIKK